MTVLPTFTFVRQRFSPGMETYTIYASELEFLQTRKPVGWVDIDWDDQWHVAPNRPEC